MSEENFDVPSGETVLDVNSQIEKDINFFLEGLDFITVVEQGYLNWELRKLKDRANLNPNHPEHLSSDLIEHWCMHIVDQISQSRDVILQDKFDKLRESMRQLSRSLIDQQSNPS